MSLKSIKKQQLVTRRNRVGYVFIAPFIIGFVLFLLIPIVQSFIFSLNEIKITVGGYSLIPKGLTYYNRAFFVDPLFRLRILQTLQQVSANLPTILAFSFFASLLLNQKFKGRPLARTMFFLPVIISTGIMVVMDSNNIAYGMMLNRSTLNIADTTRASFSAIQFVTRFFGDSLPSSIMEFIMKTIDRIYDVVISSGVQILIFLGGLNTISPSLYESSNIEGATSWQNFWKITFPMMGPYILLNTVYTTIDSFTNISNDIIKLIRNYMISFSEFSFGSAIAWIYFSIIFISLALILLILSKRVFYYE